MRWLLQNQAHRHHLWHMWRATPRLSGLRHTYAHLRTKKTPKLNSAARTTCAGGTGRVHCTPCPGTVQGPRGQPAYRHSPIGAAQEAHTPGRLVGYYSTLVVVAHNDVLALAACSNVASNRVCCVPNNRPWWAGHACQFIFQIKNLNSAQVVAS